MANRKRDAGREALEKKGWWRSHRWLVLRRLCQFFVLGMFLSGPWFGVWILHGNYSSSLLFDTVPLACVRKVWRKWSLAWRTGEDLMFWLIC